MSRMASIELAPSAVCNALPCASPVANGTGASNSPCALPLMPTALANSPLACESSCSNETDIEPADWPITVTLPGSPPNAAMPSCTHCSAAIWSRMPQLVAPAKPSAPRR